MGQAVTREEHPVVIIGSGFAGLCMGIKLDQAGISDYVILERGSDIGGTWRDNDYPGCACDVQSHLYSYSFEPNPDWSRMFAPQKEIQQYLLRCVEKYGLRSHIRFNEGVEQAEYDETSGTWSVRTSKGNVYHTRSLVSGIGALSNPSYPVLPGLERFAGKKFHSAHWDHEYELAGKRVAVIGTGASAIQFVPQIAPKVAKLSLFQRSAPWVISKPDRATTGFERALFKALPFWQRMARRAIYWKLESRVLGFVNPELMKYVEKWGHDHIAKQIQDPELRRKVTPSFSIGCKRILMSNDYYPALARPNVDVVTSDIVEVREHSVVTSDGREHEVDAIIFGTGFTVQEMLPKGMLLGPGGVDITDTWPQGAQAHKGTSFAGFPNFFMICGPNTGLGHSSMVFMIESQVKYIVEGITRMRREGWQSVDVKPEVQREYNEGLQRKLGKSVWLSGCKSWYLDKSGRNTALWPSFTFKFREQLAHFNVADYAVVARAGGIGKARSASATRVEKAA